MAPTQQRLAVTAFNMARDSYWTQGIPETRRATCQRLLVLTSALARVAGKTFRDVRPVVARAMVQALPTD